MHALSLAACRRRQSPRTGFVHYFPSDNTACDTIPILENFSFALALCLQKTVDGFLEGKELLGRLLAFQSPEGNFPHFLHDYPKCYDPYMSLRIAPVWVRLQEEFGSLLGDLLQEPYKRLLAHARGRTLPPIWAHRLAALEGTPLPSLPELSAAEWAEAILSYQIAKVTPPTPPFHSGLQLFTGSRKGSSQFGSYPTPELVEWLFDLPLTGRLAADHPLQMRLSPYRSIPSTPASGPALQVGPPFRLAWGPLHTLEGHAFPEPHPEGLDLLFILSGEAEMSREDLFEAAVFLNRSPELEPRVGGKRATLFSLGDVILLGDHRLTFELEEGEGAFQGHLFPANRPHQTRSGFEVFDWKIALRTLRRTGPCRIRARFRWSG